MLHIYYGDGKGKTTAAMGLALRMAGRGRRVVVAQFLKGADSGERQALAALPGVTVLAVPDHVPFTFAMTAQQREQERARCARLLEELAGLAGTCDLLVLDEVCDAVETGFVCPEQLLALLDGYAGEAVLTGRRPQPELEARADYLTHMEKVRHPYDRGVAARPGVEW